MMAFSLFFNLHAGIHIVGFEYLVFSIDDIAFFSKIEKVEEIPYIALQYRKISDEIKLIIEYTYTLETDFKIFLDP